MISIKTYKPRNRVTTGLLIAVLLVGTTIWAQTVKAHGGGHIGLIETQMDKKAALDATLPSSAKIIKKMVVLDQQAITWASEIYGVRLKEGVYRYFLAQDKQNGKNIGGSVVQTSRFRRGELSLVVGLDANQRITNVVLMGVNKNYLFELETNVGKGIIFTYQGMSVNEIVNAEALSYTNKTVQEFAVVLRDATVLLATLMRSKQHTANKSQGS